MPTSAPVSAATRAARLVAGIQLAGLLAALVFHSIVGWGLGWGFPWNTFLFNPEYSFDDFYQIRSIALDPLPYDLGLSYPPFCMWAFQPFTWLPETPALIAFLLLSLGLLALGLHRLLLRLVPLDRPTHLLLLAALLTSYPVLYGMDRANLDLLIAALATLALSFLGQRPRWSGPALLALPIALKIYPAAFLALLVARRRLAATAVLIVAVFILSWAALASFDGGVNHSIDRFRHNVGIFTEVYLIHDFGCIGTAPLWNPIKLAYVASLGLPDIPRPDSFVPPGVQFLLSGYNRAVLLLALYCGVHTCLVETSHRRRLALLALYATCSAPVGMDYKLMLLLPALVAWCGITCPRPGDQIVLWCLALAIVSKKYYFLPSLPFANIGVFLTPALQATAMLLIIWGGWRAVRLRRAVLRLGVLARLPLRPLLRRWKLA